MRKFFEILLIKYYLWKYRIYKNRANDWYNVNVVNRAIRADAKAFKYKDKAEKIINQLVERQKCIKK